MAVQVNWYINTGTDPSPTWTPIDSGSYQLRFCGPDSSNQNLKDVIAAPSDIDRWAAEFWAEDLADVTDYQSASYSGSQDNPPYGKLSLKMYFSGSTATAPQFTAFDDYADAEARIEPSGNEILDGTANTTYVSWLRGIENTSGSNSWTIPSGWISQTRKTDTYALKYNATSWPNSGSVTLSSGPINQSGNFYVTPAMCAPSDAKAGTVGHTVVIGVIWNE